MTNQWPSGERRFTRYDAESMSVSGRISERAEAVLRDISIGGASFLVKRPAKIRDKYTISLLSDETSLRLPGHVVWSRNLGEKQSDAETCKTCYTVGIAFSSSYYDESALFLAVLLRKRLFILADDIILN